MDSSKALSTQYGIAFDPARNPYGIGLLVTQNNGDSGAISVTKRSCPAPISKLESHISDTFACRHEKLFGIVCT